MAKCVYLNDSPVIKCDFKNFPFYLPASYVVVLIEHNG